MIRPLIVISTGALAYHFLMDPVESFRKEVKNMFAEIEHDLKEIKAEIEDDFKETKAEIEKDLKEMKADIEEI